MRTIVRSVSICALLALVAAAQEFRANLLGSVLDPSGGAIVGATVAATKDDTNVSRQTVPRKCPSRTKPQRSATR